MTLETRTPVIGVDVGATKIAAGRVEEGDRVAHLVRAATPASGAGDILSTVAELVDELDADSQTPAAAVGLGVPGAVDPESGKVLSATEILPGWQGTDLRAALGDRIHRPLAVDNDVRAASYGEAHRGAGREHDRALFVSVGTGVGGALVESGALMRGRHGTAGEIGHLLVPATGTITCGCGRFDHLESVVAGPAMAATYAARTGNTGLDLTEVVRRMRAGDAEALAVVTDAANLLGRALSGLVTALDVDVVVLGGGVAALGPDLLDPVERTLNTETIPPWRHTPVLPTSLGSDAPILGAALLAAHRLSSTSGAPS